jgi:hypothetical protein
VKGSRLSEGSSFRHARREPYDGSRGNCARPFCCEQRPISGKMTLELHGMKTIAHFFSSWGIARVEEYRRDSTFSYHAVGG